MTNSMGLRIRVFGVFRDLVKDRFLDLEISSMATVSDLKAEIGKRILELNPELQMPGVQSSNDVELLLSRSVLASEFQGESRVLSQDHSIQSGMELAILPPVCGG